MASDWTTLRTLCGCDGLGSADPAQEVFCRASDNFRVLACIVRSRSLAQASSKQSNAGPGTRKARARATLLCIDDYLISIDMVSMNFKLRYIETTLFAHCSYHIIYLFFTVVFIHHLLPRHNSVHRCCQEYKYSWSSYASYCPFPSYYAFPRQMWCSLNFALRTWHHPLQHPTVPRGTQ